MVRGVGRSRRRWSRPRVGVISELSRLVDVPTSSIDMVYVLVKQRAVEAGCVPE